MLEIGTILLFHSTQRIRMNLQFVSINRYSSALAHSEMTAENQHKEKNVYVHILNTFVWLEQQHFRFIKSEIL